MAPKPIWGVITSYFYPEEEEGVEPAASHVVSDRENVDEDGWMLVGPKRPPSPDADEVGSLILVNHGNESDHEEERSSKRLCEEQALATTDDKKRCMASAKQMSLVEHMLFQHTAASVAHNATTPKNSWKARNATFNKSKQLRIRSANRNPGRRAC